MHDNPFARYRKVIDRSNFARDILDAILALMVFGAIGAAMALGADSQVQIEQAHAAQVVAK